MQKLSFINHDNSQGSSSLASVQNQQAQFFTRAVQPKLTINQPHDIYEQEADAMVEQVMRATGKETIKPSFFKPSISFVQRKCQHCEEEEEKQLQRRELNGEETVAGQELVNYIGRLDEGGHPLPKEERNFYEPLFGYDFSKVKIHTDNVSAKSSQSINARAFTTGNNIVFNEGQYSPGTESGKRLLGHELTHVVQQAKNIQPKLIQRRLVVDPTDSVPMPAGQAGPPLPLTIAVQGLINDTCPEGNFDVDLNSGLVSLTDPTFCEEWHPPMSADIKRVNNTITPVGCACLCNIVNGANTVTVNFNTGGPSELPDSIPDSTNGTGSNTTVNVDPRFRGQYRINGNWVDLPFFLLFSHELCGHALASTRGTHARPGPTPPGGTPPDERNAVDVERAIANEHGLPSRPEDYSGAARERP